MWGRPVASLGARPWPRWPAVSPVAWGRGAAAPWVAPASPHGGGLSCLGRPGWGKGAIERALRSRGKRREGREWFLKLAEIPPQLAVLAGCAQLSGALASPHCFSPGTLTRALTFLWPPPSTLWAALWAVRRGAGGGVSGAQDLRGWAGLGRSGSSVTQALHPPPGRRPGFDRRYQSLAQGGQSSVEPELPSSLVALL